MGRSLNTAEEIRSCSEAFLGGNDGSAVLPPTGGTASLMGSVGIFSLFIFSVLLLIR